MKLPIPDDWNGDDYALMLVCIPDSIMWRAIVRGAIYTLTWWLVWDNSAGETRTVRDIADRIYESIMVCKLDDLLVEFKRLNAIVAGETLSLIVDGQPVQWDYTQNGVVPTLAGLELVANVEPTPVTIQVEPTPVTIDVNPASVTVEFDTASIVAKLVDLSTMLETRLTAETTAGNTRSAGEQALLDAIEDVLGGSYVP